MHKQFVSKLTENLEGVDFVVGDIHGRFTQLMSQLSEVEFDFSCDRLISVGDLVDRGEGSEKVLALLDERWFFAVRGNHEQFILDQYEAERVMLFGGYADYGPVKNQKRVVSFEANWFYALTDIQKLEVAERLKNLPYVIELDVCSYCVGVCHAGIPEEFNDWQGYILSLPDRDVRERTLRGRRPALRLAKGEERMVKNIDYTLHGHSCFKHPVFGKFCGFIDTYDLSGRLTLVSTKELMKGKK